MPKLPSPHRVPEQHLLSPADLRCEAETRAFHVADSAPADQHEPPRPTRPGDDHDQPHLPLQDPGRLPSPPQSPATWSSEKTPTAPLSSPAWPIIHGQVTPPSARHTRQQAKTPVITDVQPSVPNQVRFLLHPPGRDASRPPVITDVQPGLLTTPPVPEIQNRPKSPKSPIF